MAHPPKSQQYPMMLTSSTRKPGVQRPAMAAAPRQVDSSHALFPKLHVSLVFVKEKIINSLERIIGSDLDTAVNLKGRVMCATPGHEQITQ